MQLLGNGVRHAQPIPIGGMPPGVFGCFLVSMAGPTQVEGDD